MKAFVFKDYVYIGITSLCLYRNSKTVLFQDGIFHKKKLCKSCKWEKCRQNHDFLLTGNGNCDTINLLRAVGRRPFLLWKQQYAQYTGNCNQ